MGKEREITAELFDYDLFVNAYGSKVGIQFKRKDVKSILAEWLDCEAEHLMSFMWYRDYIKGNFSSEITNRAILAEMGIDPAKFILWSAIYNEDGELLPDQLDIPIANMDTDHIEKVIQLMESAIFNGHLLSPSGTLTLNTLRGELTKRKENEKTNTIIFAARSIYDGEPNVQVVQHRTPAPSSGL